MRQMQSDAEHISTTGRGISPVDQGHTSFDYEFDMKRMIKENLTTGTAGACRPPKPPWNLRARMRAARF